MIKATARFMLGIKGKQLTKTELHQLAHPLTAGVILFTRNYDNPAQLRALVKTIRHASPEGLLIAVDHEGGRVQRFRHGFTPIPAMAALGQRYDSHPETALQLAKATGYVLAYELGDCDIDFSFAPVLDRQTDFSQVIGDRAFHNDISVLTELATAFYQGMQKAGASGVGKHFPGHGCVVADSHKELPVSQADFLSLEQADLKPFRTLINKGIEAIMPAHVLYEKIDPLPAGFSDFWLEKNLRQQLGFDGCIVSDDLAMAAAAAYGDITERVNLAMKHCDLMLLCNHPQQIATILSTQSIQGCSLRQQRLNKLRRQGDKHDHKAYQAALNQLQSAEFV